MKKLALVLLVLVPFLALAQSSPVAVNGNNVSINALASDGNVSLVPGSSGSAVVSGKLTFAGDTDGIALAVNQVTPKAAGTVTSSGDLVVGINVIPTAVATAANFMALPVATANIGKEVVVFAAQATAVPGNLYPQTSDQIYVNGAALGVGTPTTATNSCNRDKVCLCKATGNAEWRCVVR